eukprot:6120905-Heterocapsa_arctica.AAC.1
MACYVTSQDQSPGTAAAEGDFVFKVRLLGAEGRQGSRDGGLQAKWSPRLQLAGEVDAAAGAAPTR